MDSTSPHYPHYPFARRFLRHGMLPQLAAFEATLRLGSVTRAAESLCLAQPTLSGQLRKLEEALGIELFVRRGKSLAPTAAAHELALAVREVFATLRRAEDRLDERRAATRPEPAPLGSVVGL